MLAPQQAVWSSPSKGWSSTIQSSSAARASCGRKLAEEAAGVSRLCFLLHRHARSYPRAVPSSACFQQILQFSAIVRMTLQIAKIGSYVPSVCHSATRGPSGRFRLARAAQAGEPCTRLLRRGRLRPSLPCHETTENTPITISTRSYLINHNKSNWVLSVGADWSKSSAWISPTPSGRS